MEILLKKTKDLKPYGNNPRINDASVQNVMNSIKEFGFKVPIIVDKNDVIVAGHTRYKASKRLNLKEVPCIVADDLTPEQVKAFRIADNSTSSDSEWDFDALKLELLDLPDFDMEDFGLFLYEDEERNQKDSGEDGKTIEKMELKAFEHYDYVVFVFDNQHDFLNVVQEFGIHRVDAGYKNRKLGIGRVLKGEELIKRIGNKDSYIES